METPLIPIASLAQKCAPQRVNGRTIVAIFDVPHVLKCTRNSLFRCKIVFANNREGKLKYIIYIYVYIEKVVHLDQKKKYKYLPKFKPHHFTFSENGLAFIAVNLLREIKNPDCQTCKNSLLTHQITERNIFQTF